jgi:2-aminoadipate transaminase
LPLVDLDRFDFLYANRVKGMKSAATRDLMATLSRPGIISLAGGFPDTKAFGEEAFREISRNIASDAAQALQYGPTAGLEATKDVIVEVMGAEGTPAKQEDVFVTTPRSSSTRATPCCVRGRLTLGRSTRSPPTGRA